MKQIVIDCDPGIDDAQAIMMAGMHPDVRIRAITAVAGNVDVDRTTANVLKILDVLESDPIPVYQGAASALVETRRDASLYHGEDGLGGAGLPQSTRSVEPIPAALGLIEMGKRHPGELELIALGPLTNLALALRLDPDLPTRYKNLIIMGGAYLAQGNTPNFPAEFNIFADPDAAAVVFECWHGLTMVSWELTVDNAIPFADILKFTEKPNLRSKFLKQTMDYSYEVLMETFSREVFYSADAIAMAVMIEPDIVEYAEERYVQIERCGLLTRGMTVVDWTERAGQAANVNIVRKINYQQFFRLFSSAYL